MEFYIGSADSQSVSDREISELLTQVYVDAGFVDAETARTLFTPSAVRERGRLIVAREKSDSIFAGMVIVVFPHSPARRMAQGDETEMHLLGVKPEYRGKGLGKLLVEAAVDMARQAGYSKMLLATQPTMHAAHRLYESCGFARVPRRDFNRGGREFLVYEKALV